MHIEMIDLRPARSMAKWLWIANGVLLVCLVGLLMYRRINEPDSVSDLVSARTQALATSAAVQKKVTSKQDVSVPVEVKPFDWDAALLGLEKTQVEGVSIESLKMDAVKREMSLVLGFVDYGQVDQWLMRHARYEADLRCRLIHAEMSNAIERVGTPGKANVSCSGATSFKL